MPTVDFLPVATAGGNNADSQANYAGSGYQTLGFQTGLANPAQVNKALRQGTMMAAALANFIANTLGSNVLDDGNLAALVTLVTNAITAGAGSAPTFKTNGVNNGLQSLLNLKNGANITITDDGVGGVTVAAATISAPTFKINGVNNAVQTILNLKNGTGITVTDDGVGGASIAATLSQAVQTAFLKNLGGSVGVSPTTLTNIDSQAITFPGSGGPWRVFADYSYFMNAGVGWESAIFDGTNYFAQNFTQAQNNNSILHGAGHSIGTYANGATVTFTARVFGDGTGTVVTTAAAMGSPGRVTNMGFSHMELVVLSSN